MTLFKKYWPAVYMIVAVFEAFAGLDALLGFCSGLLICYICTEDSP